MAGENFFSNFTEKNNFYRSAISFVRIPNSFAFALIPIGRTFQNLVSVKSQVDFICEISPKSEMAQMVETSDKLNRLTTIAA